MEDITIDQKHHINRGIQKLLDLKLDLDSFYATQLIFREYIKCTFARNFLYLELSSFQYEKFNISKINEVKTEAFTSKIDYLQNLILCLKIKENLSSVIKASNLYDRYLIFCHENERYYDLINEEWDSMKNLNNIEPTRNHLRIVL